MSRFTEEQAARGRGEERGQYSLPLET